MAKLQNKREIKFKAWDGEKMHENVSPWRWDFVIDNSWHKCETSTGSGILGSGGATAEMLVPAIRYDAVMQYTGLKDKSGKEIYEGDIVKGSIEIPRAPNYMGNNTREQEIQGHIVFQNCGFTIERIYPANEPNKGRYQYCPLYKTFRMSDTTTLQIIGNIHQNPELLTP